MTAPDPSQHAPPRASAAASSPSSTTTSTLSVADRRALLATCVAAAAKGAEIVRAGTARLGELTWERKSRADFVSDVDRASEEAIAAIVLGRHADARVLGEELSPDVGAAGVDAGLVFVADPLDGTTNFLHGFPWYAVSIAAAVDGALEAAVVLNAATGELFSATAGGGARRAGQPMAVSSIDDPSRALVGTGFPFKDHQNIDAYQRALPEIMRHTAGIRRPGSAALDLASVACGWFDAFWELRLAPWDLAAGVLLIREAGGLVTDLAGAPVPIAHTGIVAGNAFMHRWLMERLRDR